jgi:uncharacterized delta-60 repeat protein
VSSKEGGRVVYSVQCLFVGLVLILPIFGPAQEWVVRYNGPCNGYDWANAIAVDDAGNIYVTGQSYGADTNFDYTTVKYDASGVEQWVVRYDGPINDEDAALAIALDNVGNVYVTGASCGPGTSYDITTLKYNASGVEQWVARYDGPGHWTDWASAIAVDNEGNIYVTGGSWGSGTYDDYTTIMYNTSGVEQWVARYDGLAKDTDCAYAIALDNAGNIYVTGHSYGGGTFRDYATVKYDALGVEQWVVRYNGIGNENDCANAIALDSVGDVYVTGKSWGSGTYEDYATVKYNASGVEQWVARYDGSGNGYDRANAIAVDNADNICVTGQSWGSGSSSDYATVKYDASGVEQWVARYNGPSNGADGANAITLDNTGNIYVTGGSGLGGQGDFATVKYDSWGAEQWVARYNGPGNGDDGAKAIALDDAGNIYVTGPSYGSGTFEDYATIKYSPTGVAENTSTLVDQHEITTTIFNGSLHLPGDKKCKVFDIMGRIVEPLKITRGIYFIETDGVVTQKVVKVR